MKWEVIHIDETDSTNQWLKTNTTGQHEAVAVWADYQTAGRGCGSNHWESERAKNLTFSMLVHPHEIPVHSQFYLSMAVSVAIAEMLEQYTDQLSIKWPNDIYWRDSKIGGILIENRLHGNTIKDSIIGVGLNINQRVFHSDAPNPVSLWQITGQETHREQLLLDILQRFGRLLSQETVQGQEVRREVRKRYMSLLYRRKGFHGYADDKGSFMAEIVDVEVNGHLLLRDDKAQLRRYAFKEVRFINHVNIHLNKQ